MRIITSTVHIDDTSGVVIRDDKGGDVEVTRGYYNEREGRL